MKWLVLTLAAAALLAPAFTPSARAEFQLLEPDVIFTGPGGFTETQAGSHSDTTTSFAVGTVEDPVLKFEVPSEDFRGLRIDFPPGLIADRNATVTCSSVDFLGSNGEPKCAVGSAIGVLDVESGMPGNFEHVRVYNLVPPPGVLAKLGFVALKDPITVELGLNTAPPYNGFAAQENIPQVIPFYSAALTAWGNPSSSSHDSERGGSVSAAQRAFLTLPRSCTGPLPTIFRASSWQGSLFEETIFSHDEVGQPLGMTGCEKIGFAPRLDAQPTSDRVESPSGLDVSIDIDDEGLTSSTGLAGSDMKKLVMTLPEGMTANPSLAEGLASCTPDDLAQETLASEPGEGCPQASKIGTAEIESRLLEGVLVKGALFIAQPDDPETATPGAENPFDTLLALYLVIKDPEDGILVKLPAKIEPDPHTGQLITTFEDIPQLPVSHIRAHLREGGRSPLITPPGCGTHTTVAELTPWARPTQPLITTSSFETFGGEVGCQAGSLPFKPGFSAGTLNNDAGSYSPFYMRLTRRDGDQDLTRFSATLPPGMTAKLAGTAQCPDAAIALAKAKTGRAELATPSCPASSEIGHVLGGAGVGSQLTYVPGQLYMAGPFNGAPLSVVGIVAAVAGPFDVGTVVVRQALQIDPRTAKVRVDGSRSDPIPHILAGIPLKVRDIRVLADRPDFTLNPTSCDSFSVDAQLWGGGADVFSSLDDSPASLSQRFQAADCARLGFKPSISLLLRGGTHRAAFPALHLVYRPRPGDANLSRLALRFPSSEFIEQGHFRTICTRVQFAAGNGFGSACPAGSVYGHARVYTPILDHPFEGPVYLRSSNNNLPDVVLALHGPPELDIQLEVPTRIDSVHGGLRAIAAGLPDAPVSRAVVDMQGGQKGLFVNSTDLCVAEHRAKVQMVGHNNKQHKATPSVRAAGCSKERGGKGSRKRRG